MGDLGSAAGVSVGVLLWEPLLLNWPIAHAARGVAGNEWEVIAYSGEILLNLVEVCIFSHIVIIIVLFFL